jgi:hypothetical protein
MKELFIFLLVTISSISSVFAAVEDDSIIKELEKTNVQTLNIDFKLKSFESCESLEKVM